MKIDDEVTQFNNDLLMMYHKTYSALQKEYPNGYFGYMVEKSRQELKKRGLEP